METENIRISPNYRKSQWLSLDLENNKLDDWEIAIKIFKDRIEGRFLTHIDLIEKQSSILSGFVILSLDCLLIETLEQFYKGKLVTGRGMNEKAFYSFF